MRLDTCNDIIYAECVPPTIVGGCLRPLQPLPDHVWGGGGACGAEHHTHSTLATVSHTRGGKVAHMWNTCIYIPTHTKGSK